ncbi:serine hydrolase domain-containing protein [Allokutzneria oryzae]|uniref:Serine hydrolase domain-containing protein n=1 Tax=Allokutzneria oryzae TaxID=1378989 RepID=A0ABV6A5Y9_9PSEU
MRWILTAVLLLLAASPATAAEPGALTAAAIDALVVKHREATGLPGVAVVVTKGTEVVHAAGYGHSPDGRPITDRTPMAVASVSKSFTALAVVQLAEAGWVRLDAPVREFLPEFTMADPRSAGITVRQLLNQTSGMSDSTYAATSGPQAATLGEAVAMLKPATLAAAPGTAWSYHNPNYVVAARLVEVVSGKPFATYLRDHVFAPLRMNDSTTADTDRDLPPSARGHLMPLGFPLAVPEPTSFGNGSGGVLSTARDMAAWLIAQNYGGGAVVSPAGLAELRTPTPVSGSYALGWSLDTTASGSPVIEHAGDLFTSTAYQAVLPSSGYGIAVMANTGTVYGDASTLARTVIAAAEGQATPGEPSRTGLVVTDAVMLALAVFVVAFSARGVRRAVRSPVRRGPWRTGLSLAVLVAPLMLCLTAHHVVSYLYRGRDVGWTHLFYFYPVFMVLLCAMAIGGVTVALARLVFRERSTAPGQGLEISRTAA